MRKSKSYHIKRLEKRALYKVIAKFQVGEGGAIVGRRASMKFLISKNCVQEILLK